MRNFWRTVLQPIYLGFIHSIKETLESFSISGRLLFGICAGLCIASSLLLLYLVDQSTLVTVPEYGGSLTEGLIGVPRFINPVLAISDSDYDLTALVYSGLLRATANGSYIPDLAKSYSVSPDGLTYTVVLRSNATFSDGTPVTADDVIFTIEKTQDPALNSPLAANWAGVTVQKIDSHTLQFTLKQPYAPFIENLTMGILPEHLWSGVSDQEFPFSNLNINPVGSGPFEIHSITRGADGVPTAYTLDSFKEYALGAPYLNSITFAFYSSEATLEGALRSGAIDAAGGLSPETLSRIGNAPIITAPLSRIYGVFFNQSHAPVLQDIAVRQALSMVINKQDLIKQVLSGYGVAINGPLPTDVDTTTVGTTTLVAAQALLATDGWTMGPNGILQKAQGTGKHTTTETLTFSLATGDTPELRAAAEYLSQSWSTLGAQVAVQVFNQGDLTQNVIRPRAYDALLFGEVIGREPDLYAFWSSTERNDPGLNIAMYANTTSDKILSQLRQTSDPNIQAQLEGQLEVQLQKDIPAIFLYAPDFVYSVPNDVRGLQLGSIETPSDRFLSVAGWYRQTDHVWPFFAKTSNTTK